MSETAFIDTLEDSVPGNWEGRLHGRPRLFILMGIPGSGKSTWARRFFPELTIVNTDAIREELWPGEEYKPERNKQVFETFHNRIGYLLAEGNWAVADATSLRDYARDKLYTLAKANDAAIHLVAFTSTEQAFENNKNRDERWVVPEEEMIEFGQRLLESLEAIRQESAVDSITYIGEVG